MSSSEAGPSTAPAAAPPVFKKRGKAHTASRISTITSDDSPSGANDHPDTLQTDTPSAEPAQEDDISVQDLIALRSLNRKPTGIELERLNKGERKKKSKQKEKSAAQFEEERWQQQMRRGGLMAGPSGAGPANDDDDSDQDDASKPRRLVRKNNFQGETGTVDVDKHMMAYIEQEMNKRTGASSLDASSTESIQKAINNPQDQLYAVAEKYRQLQRSIKPEQSQEEREGNVALSAAMLSSIPEVDLGMDTRMKNIQDTERAKRLMYEKSKSGGDGRVSAADQAFANARFQQPKQRTNISDFPAGENQGRGDRKQMATDHLVLDRFRKRQRNFR